jgi:cytoskeleton protein RodZ
LWPAHAPEPVTAKASSPPPIAAPVTPPAAAPVAPAVAAPQPAKGPAAMKIEIDSTEPAWISMADASGQRLAVGIVEPGKARVIDIDRPAWLRTGNAGGLTVKLNGKPLGPIGPHGKVREIRFKDGNFTITSPEPPVVH